jgi:hypothetical protein
MESITPVKTRDYWLVGLFALALFNSLAAVG